MEAEYHDVKVLEGRHTLQIVALLETRRIRRESLERLVLRANRIGCIEPSKK